MQELNGFILLHRKLKQWGWYKDSVVKDLFLHLLLSASFKDFEWMGRQLKAGQLITGRKRLAEELDFTERQIRTALDKLKSTGEVTIETTNKYTIITVVNWEDYQGLDKIATSKTTNKRPALSVNKLLTSIETLEKSTKKTTNKDELQSLINSGIDEIKKILATNISANERPTKDQQTTNKRPALSVNKLLTSIETLEKSTKKTTNKDELQSLINSGIDEIKKILATNISANERPTKDQQTTNKRPHMNNINNDNNVKNSSSDGASAAPQLPEILLFISENRLRVDGREFYKRYSENGWKTESGKRITDWKRMLKVWDKRERENKPTYANGYSGVKNLADD